MIFRKYLKPLLDHLAKTKTKNKQTRVGTKEQEKITKTNKNQIKPEANKLKLKALQSLEIMK